MLKIIFEKNKNFKKMFVKLILEENEIIRSSSGTGKKIKFFDKFWEFYRDSLFFSAYNFFHNSLWDYVTHYFVHLSDFLL